MASGASAAVSLRFTDASVSPNADDAFVKPFDETSQSAPSFAFGCVELSPCECLGALATEREHERPLHARKGSRPAEAARDSCR